MNQSKSRVVLCRTLHCRCWGKGARSSPCSKIVMERGMASAVRHPVLLVVQVPQSLQLIPLESSLLVALLQNFRSEKHNGHCRPVKERNGSSSPAGKPHTTSSMSPFSSSPRAIPPVGADRSSRPGPPRHSRRERRQRHGTVHTGFHCSCPWLTLGAHGLHVTLFRSAGRPVLPPCDFAALTNRALDELGLAATDQ